MNNGFPPQDDVQRSRLATHLRHSVESSASRTLAESFLVCSHVSMDRDRLSLILQTAPTWVRLGLTVRDSAMRERAADALAATIIDRLDEPLQVQDRNQLALPL